MNFRKWLPITVRNRVALGFAALALVMFVVWNCLPNYRYGKPDPDGIVGSHIWISILSPDVYIMVLKSPFIGGFFYIAFRMALVQCGLVTLVVLPFWRILHASACVRMPLAFVNLISGAIAVWILIRSHVDPPIPYAIATLSLTALNMFALSAALFIFKNELALREERSRPKST